MQHTFAIFFPNLPSDVSQFTLRDKDVFTRITKVLRLKVGENLIFFNDHFQLQATLTAVEKKSVNFDVKKIVSTAAPETEKTVYFCVTKKKAFEQALYHAVEVGAHAFVPVVSEKSNHAWYDKKNEKRMQEIITAAREQAKNYYPFVLHSVTKLNAAAKAEHDLKIVFDATGKKMQQAKKNQNKSTAVFIGPEAGLTENELTFLCEQGYKKTLLTQTVLRAQTAVVLVSWAA